MRYQPARSAILDNPKSSHHPRCINLLYTALLTLGIETAIHADEVHVAVAANFTAAATEIGARFAKETGHEALFSFGSTGLLYAQISQGAPFEVFLAADQETPARAVEDGLADADDRFTYAIGRIALYSADPDLVSGEDTLRRGSFSRIAIANPETAPYGAAAVEVMETLGVYASLRPKVVLGNNIAQAFQFVATHNAEIGFVALSQIMSHAEGSRWIVPTALHSPLAQDAVLLRSAEQNEAAHAFVDFLKGAEAGEVIERFGYAAGPH